jgi:hypothetical protein
MLIARDGKQLRMVALRGLDRLAERGIGVFQLCLSVKVNFFARYICALQSCVTFARYSRALHLLRYFFFLRVESTYAADLTRQRIKYP